MRKNVNGLLAVVFGLALFLGSAYVPQASANSAQYYWSGTTRTGAIVSGGECPLTVESELLTFDLQEFPSNYYFNKQDFLAYTGKVTAEYAFYNPSDINVEATLLFPFGKADYGYYYDEESGARDYYADAEKYDILVDGEAVEKSVRYTLSDSIDDFDLKTDLSYISSDFVSDDFFNPDLPVTTYKYICEKKIDFDKYPSATVALDIGAEDCDYKVLFPNARSERMLADNKIRVGASLMRVNSFEIIKFGYGTFEPTFKLYKNGSIKDENEISGTSFSVISEQTQSFKQFALQNRAEDSPVSEVDWVNALVCELNSNKNREEFPIVYATNYFRNYENCFMRWYEYKISVPAGARITNTVTAPIYPSINLQYTPSVFRYTYLLSPASSWKSFGSLKVVINTPYYMSDCSISGFEKTSFGYEYTCQGLPENELSFNLSLSKPVLNKSKNRGNFTLFYWGMAIALFAVVFGVVLFLILKKRRKKA